MNNGIISVTTSSPPGVLDLLTAAVAELDAVVDEGLGRDLADRLNAVSGLIEEALGKLEERRP